MEWRRWGSNLAERSPLVSSQALYHWATVLPRMKRTKSNKTNLTNMPLNMLVIKIYVSDFETKTYVVGIIKKKGLSKKVLLSTQNTCFNEWIGK